VSVAPLERHVRVHRTARLYQLGTPSAVTRELWLACHGYGQLAGDFAPALKPLNDGSRIVVAPEGLSRFYLDDPTKHHGPDSPVGASWMTREDREREIADYVEYLDIVAATIRREIGAASAKSDFRVVALGFSQGVATACRWTAFGNARIHRLIMWGGTVPTDLPADRGDRLFRGAELTLVAGRRDELVTGKIMEREQRMLADKGLHAELLVHEGGHSLSSETLRRLATAAQ
jgi:predicted esterase